MSTPPATTSAAAVPAAPPAAPGWDALLGAALLGTERRPADLAALPAPVAAALAGVRAATGRADAPTALLDAAALLTAYRRAGRAPLPGRAPLAAAPAAAERRVGAAAAARLGSLLAPLDPAARGGGAGGRADGLLRTWLHLAGEAGLVVPPARLPALLDLAARRPEVAAALAPVLGARGWWLAGHRADWSAALEPHRPAPERATGDQEPGEQTSGGPWEHGTAAERRAWLRALRRRDPGAARAALLALPWRSERAEDRAAFVEALADGLSAEDEELLERARADRGQDVRRRAERLLALLPGAAWAQQVRRAALAALALERRRLRRTLVVTLPDPADAALPAVSAGAAPAGVGPGAWALQHLVALTPPAAWEEALGESAERLAALPVDGGLGPDLHRAWARAALLHRDVRWARALLAAGAAAEHEGPLLALLPVADRVAAAVATARAGTGDARSADRVVVAVAACPLPWPPPLAEAVVGWLAAAPGPHAWVAHGLLERAGHALPATAATAGAVRAAADALPADSPWRPALTDVADTVAERHQMLEELR
ncbi:DUF5691 domain-containing protein [Kineococcus sp. SYSU DK006]|uniref:DUF5691 domain-containing protein n=1 Tax=Kineococcus sp. SYSU DK006 TaxID=3383127 RepID=UPI003D7C9204